MSVVLCTLHCVVLILYLRKLNGIAREAAWRGLGTICGSLYVWLQMEIWWVAKQRCRKTWGGEKALLRGL